MSAATAVAGPASKLSMVRYGEPRIRGAIERKVVLDALPAEPTVVACGKTIMRNYAVADAKLTVDGDGTITVAHVAGLDEAGDRCLASVLGKLELMISPNGNVVTAKASGLHDDSVEDCVSAVVRAIEFPKPMGGSETHVTYSIGFHPAP
jgi:hypothetical protein